MDNAIQTRRLPRLLVPAALFVIAVAVYLPARNGDFLWDDDLSIQSNPLLHRAGGIRDIWTTVGKIPGEGHYWPITYSALWFGTRCWGDRPIGFHMVNMLLHALIVVQIWRLMRRMNLPGAWLGAALFALHPMHVEAVAWMIAVKDLLATGIYLVAVEFYLNHAERGGWKWLAATALAALAAMLSKSSAVTLPAAIAILVWYRRGRIARRDLVEIAVVGAVVAAMTFVDMQSMRLSGFDDPPFVPPFAERLVQSGLAFGFYLGKLIWPARLSAIYPQFHFAIGNPAHWMPLVAIVLVTAVLWLARARIGRGPLACWAFYVAALGPTLGIVYFGFLIRSPVADRYQYLASIGPIVGIAALAGGWIEKQPMQKRTIAYAPVAAVLVLFAIGTARQAGFYTNTHTFFWHVLEVTPESSVAYYNLGSRAFNQKNYPLAEKFFAQAHRFAPEDGVAVYSLGEAMIYQGKIRQAAQLYSDTIDAGCVYLNVGANLAWLMAVSPDPAIHSPEKALRLASQCVGKSRKEDPEILNAYAAALAANGRTKEAVDVAKKALAIARENRSPDMISLIEMVLPYYEQGKPYVANPGQSLPANGRSGL